MAALRSVVLAGGGTGGHIYPLLAFADCLRRHDPGLRITCIGSQHGMEGEIIPQRGYDLRHVPAYQLPRSVNMNLVRTPDRMCKAARATREILDEVEADAVVGFGGYVSVPAYLAAWRRKTPTIIHEVNVPPGRGQQDGHALHQAHRARLPHQAAADPVGGDAPRWSGCRCGRASPPSTGPRCGSGPARTSASTRTCRRCSSSARPPAPGRSTWRCPARRSRSPAPGCRCCTSSAPATTTSRCPAGCPRRT